jgi:hypothetical protein
MTRIVTDFSVQAPDRPTRQIATSSDKKPPARTAITSGGCEVNADWRRHFD